MQKWWCWASKRVWNRNYCMSSGVARERVECVVIGAGVVGLCVARELALRGRQVLVLDSAPTFGTGTSSRNSEVIHAGIYYPPNSLKVFLSCCFLFNTYPVSSFQDIPYQFLQAIFCVRGRQLLYQYCSERQVPHKQIGKLIVATGSSEIHKLHYLMDCGIQNGVDGLVMMEGSQAMRIEPELRCSKALLSPVSGIVDTHSFMLSLVVSLDIFYCQISITHTDYTTIWV